MMHRVDSKLISSAFVIFLISTFPTPGRASDSVEIKGILRSSNGSPVQGDVTIVSGRRNVQTANVKTGLGGEFLVRVDPSSAWLLVAKAENHVSAERVLRFVSGASSLDLRIVLEPAITICGQVIDGEGMGVSNAEVYVAYADGRKRRFFFSDEMGPVVADESGTFCVPRVALGSRFELQAWVPGYLPGTSGVLTANAATAQAGVLVPLVSRGATVRGRIVDATGVPISGADVRLRVLALGGKGKSPSGLDSRAYWRPALQRTRSGPDGTFVFAGVPGGRIRIVATKDGFQASRLERRLGLDDEVLEETLVLLR